MMTCTALLIFSIGTFYHKDHDPFISTVASISRFSYKNYPQRKGTYLICGNIEQHNLQASYKKHFRQLRRIALLNIFSHIIRTIYQHLGNYLNDQTSVCCIIINETADENLLIYISLIHFEKEKLEKCITDKTVIYVLQILIDLPKTLFPKRVRLSCILSMC